jgi:hypothetical protein
VRRQAESAAQNLQQSSVAPHEPVYILIEVDDNGNEMFLNSGGDEVEEAEVEYLLSKPDASS